MDMAAAAVWISLAACMTSVAGLLLKHDRRNEAEALWRGEVNAKLDVLCGIKEDVNGIKKSCGENARNIAVIDASAKSAHHRIDELTRGKYRPGEALGGV